MRALTSAFALDREQSIEEVASGQGRVAGDRPIQEMRLRPHADGRRVVPVRRAEVAEHAAQPIDGNAQMRCAIAEVAAEGDRDAIQSSACRLPSRDVR